MTNFFDMLNAALYAVFIQNLILTGGYGMSEVVRMATKPKRLASFAFMIVIFSTATGVICRLLEYIPKVAAAGKATHFLIYAAALILLYVFSSAFIYLVLKPDMKLLTKWGVAALNTLVLAIPLINERSVNTVWESIGIAFGSGIAFVLACMILSAGITKISKNKHIPKNFRGTPVMFIYVALVSMAFSAISGTSAFA